MAKLFTNFCCLFLCVCALFSFIRVWVSGRLAQGDVAQWDDPETGSIAINKPASRHFYPIALLLVSSHLLVVWLILSLVFLLAKYQ